jgi:hypothetical protein
VALERESGDAHDACGEADQIEHDVIYGSESVRDIWS